MDSYFQGITDVVEIMVFSNYLSQWITPFLAGLVDPPDFVLFVWVIERLWRNNHRIWIGFSI